MTILFIAMWNILTPTPLLILWRVQDTMMGGANYGINPVGSYVRTFDLPKGWSQQRTIIHFAGVYSAAMIG